MAFAASPPQGPNTPHWLAQSSRLNSWARFPRETEVLTDGAVWALVGMAEGGRARRARSRSEGAARSVYGQHAEPLAPGRGGLSWIEGHELETRRIVFSGHERRAD